MRAQTYLEIYFHGDFDMEEKEVIGKHLHSCKTVKKVLIRKADTIFTCIKCLYKSIQMSVYSNVQKSV